MSVVSEQDEFLLSQLLDGDLPAEQAAALRERIEREPPLREAYESLERVNGLLGKRRADQPEIDWGRFQADVMDRVDASNESAAVGGVIRLSRWLGFGVPLAAAAAVALVFVLRDPTPETDRGGTLQVAVNRPAPVEEGALKVTVDRPDAKRDRRASVRVAYVQSASLDAVYEQIEKQQQKSHFAIFTPDEPNLPAERSIPEVDADMY